MKVVDLGAVTLLLTIWLSCTVLPFPFNVPSLLIDYNVRRREAALRTVVQVVVDPTNPIMKVITDNKNDRLQPGLLTPLVTFFLFLSADN